jgi:tyrosyl-tRNA synthetase
LKVTLNPLLPVCTTTSRIQRCCTIMGRKDSDELSAAQIMYPCMQCADVFFLKADICQLGMDQRKVQTQTQTQRQAQTGR